MDAHKTQASAAAALAAALVEARLTGAAVQVPAGKGVSGGPGAHHDLDLDSAYAAQAHVARALRWFDAAPRHWKSGGASRDTLQTHAPLPPSGVWTSPAEARSWPFHQRGIEAEVALRLARAVDADTAAGLDLAGARSLVDAMTVSIEIVDSRWIEGLQAPPLARLADLQSHGALVLGAWVPFDAARDWAQQRCTVAVGLASPQVFVGTHSMGDPAFVLPAWLRHATRDGQTLAAGTVVTTGTWCGLLPAAPGDEVQVAFEGLGHARVRL